MLDAASTWTDTLTALPPAQTPAQGFQNLAAALGKLMNKVQAGSAGSVGIFTFAEPILVAQLTASLAAPISTTAWAPSLAAGWLAACEASVITPATVSNAAWTLSTKDTNTLPTGAATILTLAAAAASLQSDLLKVATIFQDPKRPPADYAAGPAMTAAAFRNATLAFTFTCIGIVAGTPPVPLPIPFNAQ